MGRRHRRPVPLAVSTAISFVLSAQCCFAQILENPNLVTSSGTSHFCETEIEPFPYNVLVNFLLPQNRCRSLRTLPCIRGHKKRCRVSTPTPLCLYLYFIFLYKVHIPYHGNISLPPPAKTNILSRFPRTSFHAFSSLQISCRTIRW